MALTTTPEAKTVFKVPFLPIRCTKLRGKDMMTPEKKKVITVREEPCEITGHTAKYYSTDVKYFHSETQSELFQTEDFLI